MKLFTWTYFDVNKSMQGAERAPVTSWEGSERIRSLWLVTKEKPTQRKFPSAWNASSLATDLFHTQKTIPLLSSLSAGAERGLGGPGGARLGESSRGNAGSGTTAAAETPAPPGEPHCSSPGN